MFSATLTGLDAAIGGLQASLDEEGSAAFLRAAGLVADDARSTHAFANRTRLLESRIVPGQVRGRLLAGNLQADVLGATRYGGYVEEGTRRNRPYPYLAPASDHAFTGMIAELEAGLATAARRAGWA